MRISIQYIASDGKTFNSERQCLEHEQRIKDAEEATGMLLNGATLMAALNRANQTRPYWDVGMTMEDKARLMNITEDTGFAVPHWQCSDLPCYQLCGIRSDGRVFLYGNPSPERGYGNWIDVKTLLEYARQMDNAPDASTTALADMGRAAL